MAALIAAGYASDYEGEAYRTVSGQNSNNSVRIPNEFFRSLANNEDWEMTARSDGKVMKKCLPQSSGTRYLTPHGAVPIPVHNTIPPSTNGIPALKVDRIRASNPCSEYMFLDNTACNLASLNLRQFFNESR